MGKNILVFKGTGYYIPAHLLNEYTVETLIELFEEERICKYSDRMDMLEHKFNLYFDFTKDPEFYFISQDEITILAEQGYRSPNNKYFQDKQFAIKLADYGMHDDD